MLHSAEHWLPHSFDNLFFICLQSLNYPKISLLSSIPLASPLIYYYICANFRVPIFSLVNRLQLIQILWKMLRRSSFLCLLMFTSPTWIQCWDFLSKMFFFDCTRGIFSAPHKGFTRQCILFTCKLFVIESFWKMLLKTYFFRLIASFILRLESSSGICLQSAIPLTALKISLQHPTNIRVNLCTDLYASKLFMIDSPFLKDVTYVESLPCVYSYSQILSTAQLPSKWYFFLFAWGI